MDPAQQTRRNPIDRLEQRLRRLRAGELPWESQVDLLQSSEKRLEALHAKFRRPGESGDAGRRVQAQAIAWQTVLENDGLEEASQATGAFLKELQAEEGKRWRRRGIQAEQQKDAPTLFQILSLMTRSDLRQPEEQSPFHQDRRRLREALLSAIKASPPEEELRDLWLAELMDRADSSLTALDDMSPKEAARCLDVVSSDLRWHRQNIEKEGPRAHRLTRKLRRLRAERQERRLQAKLETRFGTRAMGHWERMILLLILVVLVILIVEMTVPLSPNWRLFLTIVDTFACTLFLIDFGFKLALVEHRRSWFLRHFLVDFLPSLPFNLFLHHAGADPARAGRAARLFRLPRVARYLRLMMPVIRAIRAFGFLAKGLDRIVRRYGNLLNSSIILYPNRRERAGVDRAAEEWQSRLWRLRSELNDLWQRLYQEGTPQQRKQLSKARLHSLRSSHALLGDADFHESAGPKLPSEWTAEEFLRRLGSLSPDRIEEQLGPDQVGKAAKILRMFHVVPLRWLPMVKAFLPRLSPGMRASEVVAAAARRSAASLQRYYGRMFWILDWYGTITPSEVVDRVGSAMVKGSFRPAYRLTLFGGIYLLAHLILEISGLGLMQKIADFLDKYVGPTLILVGGVCFIILGLGWWMKKMAKEATSFLEQTAEAQYLPFTEAIKSRNLERDTEILDRRILEPEDLLVDRSRPGGADDRRRPFKAGVRAWLLGARESEEALRETEAMERVILLYRDSLKGSLLCQTDTRTTDQLLGNLALCHLRDISSRIDRKENRALNLLDLDQQRGAFKGPYLWFSLISKAIAQTAARLIVEYNRNAIPLNALSQAPETDRRRYQAWLERRNPEPEENRSEKAMREERSHYLTTAFTALHFLDDDKVRDQDVAEEFGEAVLQRVQEDRQRLFRTIFGTFPVHHRPKDRRTLNPYEMYQSWLAGGRALFMPFFFLIFGLRLFGRLVVLVAKAVQEIRKPKRFGKPTDAAQADFAAAQRKINRMRGPVVEACLWLRARFDPEYLGVQIPRTPDPDWSGRDVMADLRFLDAEPSWYERLTEERASASADMRRLESLFADGLLQRIATILGRPQESLSVESIRAAAVAYRADFKGIRSLLSCGEILHEACQEAAEGRRHFEPRFAGFGVGGKFNRFWKQYDKAKPEARPFAWRAIQRDFHGSKRALQIWADYGPEEARRRGEQALAEILRYSRRVSEQLVTLRTIQTLSLIDVLNYREHVFRLGGYGEPEAASSDRPLRAFQIAE
ncbi:MAG: hypothetical protein DWQ01_11230 [Planctomycetota bacterium]|nr:MAG: hypothetical protein DWQ01_11230 [Planctomycetota bacterium]